jgi:hypothetical protein
MQSAGMRMGGPIMTDAQRPRSDSVMAARERPQPWELGKRYIRGELEAGDFLDQSSRVVPVRISLARAIAGFIGFFVVVSYAVLALYLLNGDKYLPAVLSFGGAVAVSFRSFSRWRKRY